MAGNRDEKNDADGCRKQSQTKSAVRRTAASIDAGKILQPKARPDSKAKTVKEGVGLEPGRAAKSRVITDQTWLEPVVLPDKVLQSIGLADSRKSGNPALVKTIRTAKVHSAQLPLAAVKIRNVIGEVIDLTTEIIPNKAVVQGVIHEQLFFVGTDGIVHHLADEIPFTTFIDLPGARPGMKAQVTAVIEQILTELAPDGLSVVKKIIIEIFVLVTESVQTGLLLGSGPLLLLELVVGESTVQTLLEERLILAMPALKVEEVTGNVQDLTTEIIADKVIIQGVLHQQIFFVDGDNRGCHQAEDLPFSTFIDLPGAAPGMSVQIQPRLETLIYELIAPTVLRQRAIIEFFVKVTMATRQNASLGDGPLFNAAVWVNENTVQDLNETVVILPVAAVKICDIAARIRDLVTQVVENKVIVQGTIHKQIFYIDVDNIERHQAEESSFAVFLDLPGAVPGDQVDLTSAVEGLFFVLETPTQLRQRVVIAITAVVSRKQQLNLALSVGPLFMMEELVCRGTKQVLVVKRETINPPAPPPVTPTIVTEIIVVDPGEMLEAGQQIVLRNQTTLPAAALSVKAVDGKITDQQYWLMTTGVLVEGVVVKEVAFVDLNHVVRRISEQVPFSIMIPVAGIDPDLPVKVNVRIEDLSFGLNDSGVELDQTIVLQATVGEQRLTAMATIVTDVTGPGVSQSKLRVVGLVLLPDGQVAPEEFDAVTEVGGPGIVAVEKQTVALQVVGSGNSQPVPVEVVTKVTLAQ